MKDKRIVVALGRNAFGETFPEQKKNVKKGAEISGCYHSFKRPSGGYDPDCHD